MYKVITEFLDNQDDNYHYHVGDVYPREGAKAPLERAAELLGTDNKLGVAVIEEEAETKKERAPKAKRQVKNDAV